MRFGFCVPHGEYRLAAMCIRASQNMSKVISRSDSRLMLALDRSHEPTEWSGLKCRSTEPCLASLALHTVPNHTLHTHTEPDRRPLVHRLERVRGLRWSCAHTEEWHD